VVVWGPTRPAFAARHCVLARTLPPRQDNAPAGAYLRLEKAAHTCGGMKIYIGFEAGLLIKKSQ